MAMKLRSENLFMSEVCEAMEDYDGMMEYMHHVIYSILDDDSEGWSKREESAFLLAVRRTMEPRLERRRKLFILQKKEEDGSKASLIRSHFHKIDADIKSVCGRLLQLVGFIRRFHDKVLFSRLSPALNVEHIALYYKMEGDCFRYLAEFKVGEEWKRNADAAKERYEYAWDTAKNLPETNLIRLEVALNYSVFYFEIMNSPEKACELARKVLTEVIPKLDRSEASYGDALDVLQTLQDKVACWNTQAEQHQVEGPVLEVQSNRETEPHQTTEKVATSKAEAFPKKMTEEAEAESEARGRANLKKGKERARAIGSSTEAAPKREVELPPSTSAATPLQTATPFTLIPTKHSIQNSINRARLAAMGTDEIEQLISRTLAQSAEATAFLVEQVKSLRPERDRLALAYEGEKAVVESLHLQKKNLETSLALQTSSRVVNDLEERLAEEEKKSKSLEERLERAPTESMLNEWARGGWCAAVQECCDELIGRGFAQAAEAIAYLDVRKKRSPEI